MTVTFDKSRTRTNIILRQAATWEPIGDGQRTHVLVFATFQASVCRNQDDTKWSVEIARWDRDRQRWTNASSRYRVTESLDEAKATAHADLARLSRADVVVETTTCPR